MKKRILEIDLFRGIAIIMMIIFHFLWDLIFFYNFNINLSKGFWNLFQISTAGLFLLLVGISVVISDSNKNVSFIKYLKKGLKIFFLGLIITLITIFIFPDNFIVFGILHLIGLSIILSYFFRKFKYLNLFFGFIIIILGYIIKKISINFNLFYFLGFSSNQFNSLDYFPIFPWFGLVLIGIFIGNTFYLNSKSKFKVPNLSKFILVKPISFLGRHSLIIYLFHQIVLYGLFLAFKVFI